jgi:hypothetical protein
MLLEKVEGFVMGHPGGAAAPPQEFVAQTGEANGNASHPAGPKQEAVYQGTENSEEILIVWAHGW